MLISSVKNVNLIHHGNLGKKSRPIYFKGKNDSFISSPEIIKGSISQVETDNILNEIKKDNPIAKGWTSKIYKIGDKIVKIPIDKPCSGIREEKMIKGQNIKEYFALSVIKDIDPSIATNPYGIIKDKDKYYLAEEAIEGVNPKGNKLNDSHVADLLTKFFKLDTNGITNCDLQSGNIFLTKDDKVKFIDFGSFNFITNDGIIASSDSVMPDLFVTKAYADTSLSSKTRFLKTFISGSFNDSKNLADNPYLKVPSCATNFEFRTLYTHLLDNSEQNPLEFYKSYLKSKAQNYHAKLKEFLQGLSFEEIENIYPKDKIDFAKKELQNAINYENLIKEVLSNPDEEVIKVELSKIQLRTFMNLNDSLKSPIENSKKLQDSYNQLISNLEIGIKNSDGEKKQYFTKTLEHFKNMFKNYNFAQGQTAIPENENLVKVLFKKVEENIKKSADEAIQHVQNTAKNPQNVAKSAQNIAKKGVNKKFIFFTGALVAVSAGIAGFMFKKGKNIKTANTAQISTPSAKENIDNALNKNYLLKNTPAVYSKFKSN